MPNYGVVTKFCNFKKKDIKCPAVFDADASVPGVFGERVEACLGKDGQCKTLGCKYADGANDPFAA